MKLAKSLPRSRGVCRISVSSAECGRIELRSDGIRSEDIDRTGDATGDRAYDIEQLRRVRGDIAEPQLAEDVG